MGGGVPTSIGSLTPFSHNQMSAVLSITNSEAAGGWCGGLRERENRCVNKIQRDVNSVHKIKLQ